MTESEYKMLSLIEKKKEKIICGNDLKPYLRDRTLLYGYTCDRETFHVYLKNKDIHTVVYKNDYSENKVKPKNMIEIDIESNDDFVPNKRLYPECCDFCFCRLLKIKGIYLPFTTWNNNRKERDFYGFTLEDALFL